MEQAEHTVESRSVEETHAIGGRIGAALHPGDVLALIGGLGAGKTQFVKGVAAGAGVEDPSMVTSPTFVIVNEYAARVYLHHIDAYRLSGSAELAAIGMEEVFSQPVAVLIEWADRVSELLPEDRLEVHLSVTGPNHRTLRFQATGPASERLLAAAHGQSAQ